MMIMYNKAATSFGNNQFAIISDPINQLKIKLGHLAENPTIVDNLFSLHKTMHVYYMYNKQSEWRSSKIDVRN
jgi:hypothetical protein